MLIESQNKKEISISGGKYPLFAGWNYIEFRMQNRKNEMKFSVVCFYSSRLVINKRES